MSAANKGHKLGNFFARSFLHCLIIFITVFITSCLIAFAGGEIEAIKFELSIVWVAQKWLIWLQGSWSQLTWDMLDSIKLKLVLATAIPVTIALTLYIIFFKKIIRFSPFKNTEKIFGDASWSDAEDVERANLRSKRGMLLGVDHLGYFVADGFQHTLLFAPTGSGKGVGFVIPNLLFWDHSVFVHDIKLENYQLTSGWRAKQGQAVYVWEPSNPDGITHCYNPIDWVSEKPGQRVDDVQKIANLVLPKQEFWENEARSLFLGVVLCLIADPEKVKSFGEVVRTMRSDDVVYNLAITLDTLGKTIHPVGYMNIAAFLQKSDKERSGVISTLNSSLELWANPLIDAATASSDFNIQEFKKVKSTVYVGLTPDNIQRLQKLMQIFYQQATEFLSRKMPDTKEEPYGVLFLMDEFPTLGKMEQFKAGIAYFRGYRVRLFLIIQDTQQLKGTYEEAGMNSFLSNSTFRVTFAANNYETANLISQLCGTKTVEQQSQSKPKFFSLSPSSQTVSISQASRALLLPQEVIQLPRDEQIILIESFPPIKSKKIFYYQDKFFTDRLLPATFVPTQKPFDPNAHKEAEKAEANTTAGTDEAQEEHGGDPSEEEIAQSNSPEEVKEVPAENPPNNQTT